MKYHALDARACKLAASQYALDGEEREELANLVDYLDLFAACRKAQKLLNDPEADEDRANVVLNQIDDAIAQAIGTVIDADKGVIG